MRLSLLFIVLATTLRAQNIDSLKQALIRLDGDTTSVSVLIQLAKGTYNSGKRDSGMYYAGQAVEIAKKLNYKLGQLESNYQKGRMMPSGEPAKEHLRTSLGLARELRLTSKEARALGSLGFCAYMLGDYLEAEDYWRQAIAVSRPIDARGRALWYTNLGMTYTKLTDFSRALEMLTRSNEISDSLGMKVHLGGNYIDIALIFRLQKKYDEALDAYEKATLLFVKSPAMIGFAQLGKGETLIEMGKYEEAIVFFRELNVEKYDHNQLSSVYVNLGIALRERHHFPESEQNFDRADEVLQRAAEIPVSTTVRSYVERAKLYNAWGKTEQGITYAQKAEAIASEQADLINYRDCLKVLSSLFEAKGDVQRALRYEQQHSLIIDSIAHIDQSKKLADAEIKFRLNEKDKELKLLARENELAQIREETSRTVVIVLTGGLVVLVLASAFAMIAYRKTKSKNDLLAQQKSEIENANRLISQQSSQLVEADKMKTRFFANISHELRTPVTLITGMLETLARGTNGSKEQERVNVALGNSRKLNSLIEEMLDLTRLQSNKVTIDKKTVAVAPLLSVIIRDFALAAEKAGIELTLESSEIEGVYSELDLDKFEKIISNLLSNALKFTQRQGSVNVIGRLAGDEHFTIEVIDTGKGIAAGDLPHVFDRFYQVHSNNGTAPAKGMGIGLSLVREFTHLLGGTVEVVSTPGQGSRFTIKLKVATDAAPLPEEVDMPEFAWVEFDKRPVVLLVEDHEEMRVYVKDILDEKLTIITAEHGIAALQLLRTQHVDLIVSDVMMPEMDGYTLLTELKKDAQLKRIPVLMLTARAAELDRLKGLALGVDDYLVKPFNVTELKIRVQHLLLNLSSRKEWSVKPPEEERSPAVTIDDQFLERVTSYVETRIKDPLIAVGDLSEHLGLSERQLYRKSGELTGLAPAQLIKEIRLKKAYVLAAERKAFKVSVLASEVGYDSPAYFSRQFMERFGKRPSSLI